MTNLFSVREFSGRVAKPWGLTSFSSLKKTHSHAFSGDHFRDTRDVTTGDFEEVIPDEASGTRFGTAIHDWLETWGCCVPQREALGAHFLNYFKAPNDGGAWDLLDYAERLLTVLSHAKLDNCGREMSEVCVGGGAAEWSFHLKMKTSFSPARVAQAFGLSEDARMREYAKAVAQLDEPSFSRYLHGFIDRVLCVDDGWGVLDWKTNRLQPAGLDDPDGVWACATSNHYVLQMYLYLVALQRHVQISHDNSCVQGAWLVFLKALEVGSNRGVVFIKAEEPVLAALREMFDFKGLNNNGD